MIFKEFFIDSVKYWKERAVSHCFVKIPFRAKSFQDKQIAFNQKTKRSFLMKSKSSNEFEEAIDAFFLQNRGEVFNLREISKLHDPKIHCFVCVWTFAYDNSITKEQEINSKCPDLDNGKKCIQDKIFKILEIDDRNVLLNLERRIHDDDRMTLHIFLVERINA